MRRCSIDRLFVTVFMVGALVLAGPASAVPYGDADEDGQVGIVDAIVAAAAASGFSVADAGIADTADVHPYPGLDGRRIGDGLVDLRDVTKMARYGAGLYAWSQFAPLKVTDLVGKWEGEWHNITFGSRGGILAEFSVDEQAKTVTMWCDINGGVFGAGDPPPRSGTMPYTDDGFQMDSNSPFFGHVTGSLSYDTTITGHVTEVPLTYIDRMTVSGFANPWRMEGLYTVFFANGGGQADGEWFIDKK